MLSCNKCPEVRQTWTTNIAEFVNSKYSGEHCDLLVTRNGICSTGLVRCTLSNATLVYAWQCKDQDWH